MSKIIDSLGKGAPLDQTEHDSNIDTFHGINQVIAGATHTVDITDQGDTLEFTNAGAVAVTLGSIATIQGAAHTSDFHVTLIATNAATVATITPNVANSFNTGVATIVLTVDEYVTLETDSTGLVWNIINSSDSLKVGGLSASQFLRSDANDTTTGNLTIDKASPQFSIQCADEATEDTVIIFRDELSNVRAVAYRPNGTDKLVLDARTAVGAVQAAMDITEAGKVNVAVGIFQLAGVDVTSTAAEVNYNDLATGPGTAEANKSLVLGATKNIDTIDVAKDGLEIGGVAMTRTAADINDLATKAGAETLTSKTLTSPVINTSVSGTAQLKGIHFLDNPETLFSISVVGNLGTSGAWTSSSGFASTTLPAASATAAIIRVFYRVSWLTTTDVFSTFSLRKAGEIATVGTTIAGQRGNLSANAINQAYVIGEATVPLDGSSDFEYQFSFSATPTLAQPGGIYLVGYYI